MSSSDTLEKFVLHDSQNFEDYYELHEVLGSGKFGTVYKCKHKEDGKLWAAKIIKTIRSKDKDAVKRELEIMSRLKHSTLLRCLEAYQTHRKTIMVMECITGGELFERITGDDINLTEGDCINFMRQICTGVNHMHQNNILHLDLKPENIMCLNETGYDIKIIDFGLAQTFKEGDELKVMFGTPEFVAPEIVRYEDIGFGTDMWAVGVICYTLLSGLSPFMGDDDNETLNNVTKGFWDFEDEAFDDISKDAKNFVEQLLVFKKEGRMTASQCLEHSWLTTRDNRLSVVENKVSTDRLKKFVARRRWQKTTHAVRAIGRMSILRLATQQRKQNVSPTPDNSSEKKNATAKLAGDKDQATDKGEGKEKGHLKDSLTQTSKSGGSKTEKVNSETSPIQPNDYLTHLTEHNRRITGEGYASVDQKEQKVAIDERSQSSVSEERINKGSSHSLGAATLNEAGYGFNTGNSSLISRKELRDRKVKSGVKALEGTSANFEGDNFTISIEDSSVNRHLSNETGALQQVDGPTATEASVLSEFSDRYSISDGMRKEEAKKDTNKGGSIDSDGTKDSVLQVTEQQPPALKSILKRRPKSPTRDRCVVASDLDEDSSEARSRQINSYVNKPTTAKDRSDDLPKVGDVSSNQETLAGANIPCSRQDLWGAHSDLLENESGEGKERAVQNVSLGKQKDLTSAANGGELKVDKDVILLSEQTSRSFEVNSETPVSPTTATTTTTASVSSSVTKARVAEGISADRNTVGTELPLSARDGSYVNVGAKSTKSSKDFEEEQVGSTSSSNSTCDIHESPMQSLPQKHSHPNAMESYLSHKRGTRSSSPYSRRTGRRPDDDDDNNNVPKKQDFVVAQAPVFLQKFHHVEVGLPVTYEVKFECKIDGFPKPEIIWYKDGKRVLEGHDRYKFQSGPNGWFSLIIPRVLESDKGSFMCEARNSAGKARCSGKLILVQADCGDTDGSLSPKASEATGHRSGKTVSSGFLKSVSASLSGGRKSRRTSYDSARLSQSSTDTEEKPKGSGKNTTKGQLGDDNSYLQRLRRLSSTDDSDVRSGTLPRRSASVNPQNRRRSPSVERARKKFERKDSLSSADTGTVRRDFYTMIRPRNSITSLTAKFENNPQNSKTENGVAAKATKPKLSRHDSIGKSSLESKRSLFKSNDKENGWRKDTTKSQPPPPVKLAMLNQSPGTSSLVSKFQSQPSTPSTVQSKIRSSPFLKSNNKADLLAKFESSGKDVPRQGTNSVTVALTPKLTSSQKKPLLTTDIDSVEFSPPSFLERPADQSGFTQDSVRFVTVVDGSPKPRISWHFRGNGLKDGGRFKIYEEGGKHFLNINELEHNDEGLYTCRVQNASGRVSASVQLEVSEKPKTVQKGRPPVFLQKISDVDILGPQQTARFDCKIAGEPKPEVTWLIEGKSLSESSRHKFEQHEDGRCALIICDVISDDDAIYTCLAKNEQGQACCSAELIFGNNETTATSSSSKSGTEYSSRLSLTTPPTSQSSSTENHAKVTKVPEFVARPQSLAAVNMKPAHFSCIVRGKPEPEITWEKDGVLLESNDHYNIHTEEGMSLLKLMNTTDEDVGKYICKAKNEVGSVEAEFDVLVEAPVTTEGAPHHGSTDSIEDKVEDPLFIAEDESSHVSPSSAAIFGDIPASKATEEDNPPEFEITVSVRPQTESAPFDQPAIEKADVSDRVSKPKTAPQFVELPKSVTTNNISTAKFLCMVQGDPKPTVSWKKDGQVIPSTDDRFELSEGNEESSLKIRNVTASDQGLYTCTLTNTEGEVTASADLFVEEVNVPPTFVEKPCDRCVQDGEKVVFTCKVEGQPMPVVEWLYQNQPLRSDGEVYVVSQDGDVSTLTLPDVIVDDEGEYVAKATNVAGEIQVSANLTVTAPPPKEEKKEPRVPAEAPKFIQPLQENLDAIDGAPMSLAVRVAGKPKPKMSWFFNGEQIKEDEDFKFVEDGDRYSLVIAEVFPDDGGKYVCRITNEAGTAECSANVEVKEPVQEGSPPTFAQKPRSVSTDEGCSVSLNCHVAGDLPILVTWHKDGHLINHGKRFKLETSGPEGLTRTLHIPAVLATDAGSYQCTIENKFGVDKCTASLVVKQLDEEQTDFRSLLKTRPRLQNLQNSPNNASAEVEQFDFRHVLTRHVKARKHPQVVRYLKDQQVDEGTRAVLECNIDGHPEPKISWFHEDKEIKESKFFHMTYAESIARLEISEAFSEDEGDYMCRATNSAGETKCTAKLRVKRADSDNCSSERRQSRVTQPYLNGRHNSASSSASEDTPTRKMSSTLNITLSPPVKVKPATPVTIQIDTNSLANNGIAPSIPSNYQQTTASSRLISRGDSTDISTDFDDYDPPKEAGKSPEFLSELEDVHFVEGTSARLRCKVSGEPKPDFVWLKDGTEIKEGKKYKVDVFDEEVILTVRDTTSRDAGPYILEARNSEGMAKSTAELLVTAPPTILQTPGPVRVAVGTTATIQCKFSGAPAPTVTWKKLRKRLQTGDRYVVTSSDKDTTLAINDVDERDGGRYTLVLENGLGSDEAIVSLSVIGQPDPPTGKPLVTNVDSSSVVLSWSGTSYDGGSRITGYTVESRESMGSTWKKVDKVDSTSLKVTGLQPDTEYHFRVRAENDFQISDPGRMSDAVRTKKNPVKENGIRSRSRKIISDSQNGPSKRVSIKTNDDFNKHYDLKEQIGKGRFGTVYLCVEKATGKKMAAKFITTTPKEKQEVKDEIGVMGELSHPKLLRCYDAFEDPKQMVMVLEFISGGELFERVIDDDFVLTESDVIKYIRQVCEGVKHMHDRNILHLDLKPENIMCVDTDGSDVKLIDFGLARKYTGKEGIKVMSGTPEFVAPEVINFDEIGYTTDMWSVGVIAYILLSGLSPFMGDDDSETLSNVTLGEWDFEDEAFDDISDDAKDFISKLLVKKKERRLTAEQALRHKWLNPSRYSGASNTKISTDKLKKFVARRRWQKTTNALRAVNRMTSLAATLLKGAGSNEGDEPDASVSKPDEMTAGNGSISLTSVDRNSRDTDTESMTSSLSTTSAYSSGAVSANREHEQQIDDVSRNKSDPRQSGTIDTDENENHPETPKSFVKPKFMKTIVDCVVFEGDCARFDCAIEGVPEPEVTWYLDDEEIEESDRFILDYDEGGHYSLIIRNAEENDEGDYVVIAKNKAGQVSCAAELLVEVAGDGF